MSTRNDSEELEREREHRLHAQNFKQQATLDDDGDAAEILRLLSSIDDLPISPENDPVMGQLVSTLTSTANLTPEQVRSHEWIREYILLMYLCKFPRPEGLTGPWGRIAKGVEERDPLSPEKRMELEAFIANSQLALTRSEGAKVMEESTRTVTESVVHDDTNNASGGGLLDRLPGR